MNQPNELQDVTYTEPLPTSTLSIVSLISGILGFTVFPVIGSIIAIITGYMARQETRTVPPTAAGDGMATAGIIMGYVGVGLVVIGICCALAFSLFTIIAAGTSAYQGGF
jgi:dihydroorotate dehydrogenase